MLATGAVIAAAVTLAPFALLQARRRMPDTDALLSLLALAVLGTALAQLLLYRMLRLYGGRRASLVTYLMPGFALVYGSLLLDEPLTAAAIGGLALILAGVALGSDALGSASSRAGGGSGPLTRDAATGGEGRRRVSRRALPHEDVAPYLAAVRRRRRRRSPRRSSGRRRSRTPTACSSSRSAGERVGTVSWERVNRRSRIAAVSGYAIDPALRGTGIGVPAAARSSAT